MRMEMGLKYAQGLILLLAAAFMLAVGMANKNITSTHRIIVGGSDENWHFGFNYTDWALKNSPFCRNDTLVFKYDPPSGSNIHPHSVYLLPDFRSFLNCDLTGARRVADTRQGGGEGFEFVLKKCQRYYFACGESNGIHCGLGMMKFFVTLLCRASWHG